MSSFNTYIDDIDNSICDIDEILKSREKLLTAKNNMLEFIALYAALLGGNDGIFGVLSDEIIIHILSYLDDGIYDDNDVPSEVLLAPCKRFYDLRVDVMKIFMRRNFALRGINEDRLPTPHMEDFIINCLKIHRVCYYYLLSKFKATFNKQDVSCVLDYGRYRLVNLCPEHILTVQFRYRTSISHEFKFNDTDPDIVDYKIINNSYDLQGSFACHKSGNNIIITSNGISMTINGTIESLVCDDFNTPKKQYDDEWGGATWDF
jgi:hypothetical protein